MSAAPGNIYHHIQVSGNARILLGSIVGQATNSVIIARADYTRQYANSSLRPVPTYVPRPQLHQEIREQLHDQINNEEDNSRILVVYGLGGAGKSQLVLQYVYEYQRDYTAMFWIEAGSKETIERDYIQSTDSYTIGREMQGKRFADAIDNDQDKSYIDLNYFMPNALGMHVIVTSRSSTAQEITQLEAVEVAQMESSEAANLFQRSAKITRAELDETREVEMTVRELGHLALAIALAGSYVAATPRLSSDLNGFLPEYRTRRKKLLQRRPNQYVHRYSESVLSTWETSFEAIEGSSPPAARLLSLLAFVNFEDILISFFHNDGVGVLAGNPSYDDWTKGTTSSEGSWQSFLSAGQTWTMYDVELAFETLQRYSFLQWRSDQMGYTMHKLVHVWGYDRLEVEQQRQISIFALQLMANATADKDLDPSRKVRLLPHMMASFAACSQLFQPESEDAQKNLLLVAKIQDFLYRLGRFAEAYEVSKFHCAQIERILGKEHPSTWTSMSNVARSLDDLGKYKEAECMFRQVVTSEKSILGENHPNTLTSMDNLAGVLGRLSKYEEAEKLHRHELELSKSIFSEKDPQVLASMNNFTAILGHLGKYEEAKNIHKQQLSLTRSILGKDHPSTLISMTNLASMLGRLGEFEKTEEMCRQILVTRQSILGQKHPDTIMGMSNSAAAMNAAGKRKEAERAYQESLKLKESVFGEEHPRTMLDVAGLATVYWKQGRLAEAEVMGTKVLETRKRILGPEHPESIVSMHDLASIWRSQGHDEEAMALMQDCFELGKRILGIEHPTTLLIMHALAYIQKEQKCDEEAMSLMRDCVKIRTKNLGREHPSTKNSLRVLRDWQSKE